MILLPGNYSHCPKQEPTERSVSALSAPTTTKINKNETVNNLNDYTLAALLVLSLLESLNLLLDAPTMSRNNSTFLSNPLNAEDIHIARRSLKHVPFIERDGMSLNQFKRTAPVISDPLTKITDAIVETRIFPTQPEIVKVIPEF